MFVQVNLILTQIMNIFRNGRSGVMLITKTIQSIFCYKQIICFPFCPVYFNITVIKMYELMVK